MKTLLPVPLSIPHFLRGRRSPEPPQDEEEYTPQPDHQAPLPSYENHNLSPIVEQYNGGPLHHTSAPTGDIKEPFDTPPPHHSTVYQTTLSPYLTLPPQLLLSFFSPIILSLLFTCIHLAVNGTDIKDNISHARADLLAACTKAEDRMTTFASLPRYLADNVNRMTAKGVTEIIQGAGKVLTLSVTAIEAILVFIVNAYRSLFLCFIELLVRGSLAILTAAVDLMNDAVKEAGDGIKTAIQHSVDGVNGFLSTTLSGINDVIHIFGKHIDVPTVAQPDLSALDNVHLPNSFMDGLNKLNGTLPTLAELKTKMDDLIKLPFEKVKEEINENVSTYTFNSSVITPPAAPPRVTFCNQMDTSPLDRLESHAGLYIKLGIGLCLGLIALIVLSSMAWTWWCWKAQQRHLKMIRQIYTGADGAVDLPQRPPPPMESNPALLRLLHTASHPMLSRIVQRCTRTVRGQDHLMWFLSLITHPMALAFAAVGAVGLLSVEAQLGAIGVLEGRYQKELSTALDTLSADAFSRMDALSTQASHSFADSTNTAITATSDALNGHLFNWVNTTTHTMNSTLNVFSDEITTVLNDTFANTPLYTPLQSFIGCILLQKVAGIQKALTWISDNVHITLGTVPQDVLALSPSIKDEVKGGVMQGLGASGGGDGLVGKVLESYKKKLHLERWFWIGCLGAWVVLVLLAALVALLYHRPRWMHSRTHANDEVIEAEKSLPLDPPPDSAASHGSISRPMSRQEMDLFSQRVTRPPSSLVSPYDSRGVQVPGSVYHPSYDYAQGPGQNSYHSQAPSLPPQAPMPGPMSHPSHDYGHSHSRSQGSYTSQGAPPPHMPASNMHDVPIEESPQPMRTFQVQHDRQWRGGGVGRGEWRRA